MAFYNPYAFPTAFGGYAPTILPAAQQVEGSQVGEEQAVSVSGAPVFAHSYGAPIQQTFLPQTVLPSTQFVPVAAPQIRRPGYNERLVAWRNRQKAFQEYKKATKKAIKNANKAHALTGYGYGYAAPTAFAGAYPTQFAAPAFGAYPYGATYLAGAPVIYADAQAQPAAEEGQYPTFGDFSQGQAQAEAHEEPEIRGTQV